MRTWILQKREASRLNSHWDHSLGQNFLRVFSNSLLWNDIKINIPFSNLLYVIMLELTMKYLGCSFCSMDYAIPMNHFPVVLKSYSYLDWQGALTIVVKVLMPEFSNKETVRLPEGPILHVCTCFMIPGKETHRRLRETHMRLTWETHMRFTWDWLWLITLLTGIMSFSAIILLSICLSFELITFRHIF